MVEFRKTSATFDERLLTKSTLIRLLSLGDRVDATSRLRAPPRAATTFVYTPEPEVLPTLNSDGAETHQKD